MRNRRGNTILETAMLIPVMVLLLVGMAQIAKITYLYVTLRKTVYSVASYLSAQEGVNFCDSGDPLIAAAINFGLTGTTDNSQPVFVGGLTAEMIGGVKVPGGWIGSILVGLVGAWIGSALFHFGPIIEGIQIIPAIVGAAIFVLIRIIRS